MKFTMNQKLNSIQKAYAWNMLIEVRPSFDSAEDLHTETIGCLGKSRRLRS